MSFEGDSYRINSARDSDAVEIVFWLEHGKFINR